MDFSASLDELQKHATEAKSAAVAAAKENRDQLRQRIDQTHVDLNLAVKDVKQMAASTADSAQSKWDRMKADASAKMSDVQSRIDKRASQLDAKAASKDADWAEENAAAAISYAEWAIDNAQLAVLDAIDARVYVGELGTTT